jgi:hypothetical protein
MYSDYMDDPLRTIRIRILTIKKIEKVGNFGETYDDVIDKVLDFYININKKKLKP